LITVIDPFRGKPSSWMWLSLLSVVLVLGAVFGNSISVFVSVLLATEELSLNR